MPLASSIPKYRTRVSETRRLGRDVYNVTLHGTMIVSASVWSGRTAAIRDGEADVTLSSGGWRTRTTKRRINQVLGALGISAAVYQNNFIWYVSAVSVCNTREVHPFYDGMTFSTLLGAPGHFGEELGHGVRSATRRGSPQTNPKLPSYSAYAR
jgi:hypothetical protein